MNCQEKQKKQEKESTSILILDRNSFSSFAITFIAEDILGGKNAVFQSPDKLFDFLLSSSHSVKVVIISFDVNHLNFIGSIGTLVANFSWLKVIVVIFNVSGPVVSLLKFVGVKTILSYHDSPSAFAIALKRKQNDDYLSPVVIKKMEEQKYSHHLSNKSLTNNELFILDKLIDGHNLQSIAQQKRVKSKTISNQKLSALQKIAIKNISELFKRVRSFP